MKKHLIFFQCLLMIVLASVSAIVASDNPFVGTWKLNMSKSNSAIRVRKSETITIKAAKNGLEFAFSGVDGSGNPTHSESSGTYDGIEHAALGDPAVDSYSIRRIDARTLEIVNRKAGKAVTIGWIGISADGKTSTVILKTKDPNGKDITIDQIYDRP